MNQDSRDIILRKIDENEKVSNEDLFLYDLTSYYNLNENTESFFDKVLAYKNNTLKMKHNIDISFTPEQKRIFDEISVPGKYAISATTSFGKTTIIKEYIKVYKPKIVIYIVPTNALADELLDSFSKLYCDEGYEIIDTSVSSVEPNLCNYLMFIGTQEKLTDIKWLANLHIDLFVIDEAYKLSDELCGYREISLNRNFIDYINISQNFILLLPLVNNIIGLDDFGIKLLKSDYSPVTKDFIGVNHEYFDNEIMRKILQNDEKSLIYFNSPSNLETFFWNNFNKLNRKEKNDTWIERVSKDFHEEWLPVIAYRNGIAIHNGNMPKFIQMRMVNQFNSNSEFNTIFSTSSLIEGVNTPTKNIFIKDNLIFSEKNRIKYKNLIGRAGRLNITPVGKIYYDNKYQSEFEIANLNWNNIDLKLVIQNNNALEEINREDISGNVKNISDYYSLDYNKTIEFIENSGLTYIQFEKLIKDLKDYNSECEGMFYPRSTPDLLNLYYKCYYSDKSINRYTIYKKSTSELKKILNELGYDDSKVSKKIKSIPFEFLKKLLSATINPKIRGKNMYEIDSMLKYINNNINLDFYNSNNSQIISSIIGFVYSFLPYELIPFLENIVLLNELFVSSNQKLLNDKIINYINDQIGKYNIKYYGKTDSSNKERKIIKRLFEYGIPYHVIKNDIDYLVNSVEDNFSINHIKSAIDMNDELKEKLNNYFY